MGFHTMVAPLHIRQRCKFVSDQIRQGVPFDEQQRIFLASVFEAIANGEDPRSVFGIEPAKGKKKSSEVSREKINAVLQRIALDLALSKKEGHVLTVAEAIRTHLKFANQISGYGENGTAIDEKRVRSWWDRYKEYQKLYTPFDPI